MKILVDNGIVQFTKDDFPMLVNGQAFTQSGASFFSVSLMTNLFENNEKIVFFTALPQAKELFRDQLKGRESDNIIIIESGNEDNFIHELDNIKDLEERIILFKNIEDYSVKLFNKLKDKELVIFSGDIDKCSFSDDLMKKEFKTKIFFSYSVKVKTENKIDVPKYNGHIVSQKYNGLISVSI